MCGCVYYSSVHVTIMTQCKTVLTQYTHYITFTTVIQ